MLYSVFLQYVRDDLPLQMHHTTITVDPIDALEESSSKDPLAISSCSSTSSDDEGSDSSQSLFGEYSDNDRTWRPQNGSDLSSNENTEEEILPTQSIIGTIHTCIREPTPENQTVIEEIPEKKSRKRKRRPENWKKNKRKQLRNAGLNYINVKNNMTPGRTIKPHCTEGKCKFECKNITDEQRMQIFKKYWALGELNLQWNFIGKSMEKSNVKYRRVKEQSTRGANYAYFFEVEGKKYRVCKLNFTATLGVSDKIIANVQRRSVDGFIPKDKRGTHNNHKKIDEDLKEIIRGYINSIPRVESHYLRNQTSREFISGERTLADIHRDYVTFCKEKGSEFGNYVTFRNIFNTEFNISFFQPKKDLCSLCESYKNATDKIHLTASYNTHRQQVNLSRKEKENDSKSAKTNNCITACFDLQAVLPTPSGEVSLFYYKRRLSTFNFTIFDMTCNAGHCYLWYEGIAHRGPNEIASCLLKFFTNHASGKEIILYSDNCSGQNKNKFIVCLYLYAVQKLDIPKITHKFLITGHSQNEGDNMHSLIEKQKKGH